MFLQQAEFKRLLDKDIGYEDLGIVPIKILDEFGTRTIHGAAILLESLPPEVLDRVHTIGGRIVEQLSEQIFDLSETVLEKRRCVRKEVGAEVLGHLRSQLTEQQGGSMRAAPTWQQLMEKVAKKQEKETRAAQDNLRDRGDDEDDDDSYEVPVDPTLRLPSSLQQAPKKLKHKAKAASASSAACEAASGGSKRSKQKDSGDPAARQGPDLPTTEMGAAAEVGDTMDSKSHKKDANHWVAKLDLTKIISGWAAGREIHHGREHYNKIRGQGVIAEDLLGRHLRWADSALKLGSRTALSKMPMLTLEGHLKVLRDAPISWNATLCSAIITRFFKERLHSKGIEEALGVLMLNGHPGAEDRSKFDCFRPCACVVDALRGEVLCKLLVVTICDEFLAKGVKKLGKKGDAYVAAGKPDDEFQAARLELLRKVCLCEDHLAVGLTGEDIESCADVTNMLKVFHAVMDPEPTKDAECFSLVPKLLRAATANDSSSLVCRFGIVVTENNWWKGEFAAYNASAVSEAELADEYHELVAELTATGELATVDGLLKDAVDSVPKYVQNFRPGGAAGLVNIVVAGLVDKSARCMAALSADTAPTDAKELDSVLKLCKKMLAALATELLAEEREKLKEAIGSCEKKLASLDLERTRREFAEILKAGLANEFPRGNMTRLEGLCVKLGSAVALDTNLVKSFVDAAMSRVMEELRQGDVAMDFLDSLLAGLEIVANDVDPELKKEIENKAKLTRAFMDMVTVISDWENAAPDDGADNESQLDAVGFQRELDGLVRVQKVSVGALAEARIQEGDAIYDRFQLLETYKKQGLDRLFKRARAAVKSDVAAMTRVYDVAAPWKKDLSDDCTFEEVAELARTTLFKVKQKELVEQVMRLDRSTKELKKLLARYGFELDSDDQAALEVLKLSRVCVYEGRFLKALTTAGHTPEMIKERAEPNMEEMLTLRVPTKAIHPLIWARVRAVCQ